MTKNKANNILACIKSVREAATPEKIAKLAATAAAEARIAAECAAAGKPSNGAIYMHRRYGSPLPTPSELAAEADFTAERAAILAELVGMDTDGLSAMEAEASLAKEAIARAETAAGHDRLLARGDSIYNN